jgi:tetratricopeptide repeat protein 21B
MQDAIIAFSGTSEEDRVTIANASLALARGEVDAALGILATIDSEKRYYVEAKHKMAEIYLKHKSDQKAYARCFSELVDKEPSVESCVLLGDAYMKILEPEKAIAVYQQGLDENPQNSTLVSKIGKAFVRVHDYQKVRMSEVRNPQRKLEKLTLQNLLGSDIL